MALDLADYENKAHTATIEFWEKRGRAQQNQAEAGRADAGERGAVTAGKNMDGFTRLMCDLVHANGLDSACLQRNKGVLTLPGFFRPTKLWDLLVMHKGRLIAAIEMKSQVGPSFGNNCNNRAEEAIGTAHDFWTAYADGAFGKDVSQPFLGWLTMIEDAPGSRNPVRDGSVHFPLYPEFRGASYLDRYNILCQKLVSENLYGAACTLASPRTAIASGVYSEMSRLTGLKTFVAKFAGHVAAEAASGA
jgi:hypothetical protein